MGLNPTVADGEDIRAIVGLTAATVTDAESHTKNDGNGHYVLVDGDHFEGETYAEVLIDQHGSTAIPQEGDGVIVGYRANGEAVILGVRYAYSDTVPDFTPGERRLAAAGTDSDLRIHSDGTITLTAHGTTVEIDTSGDVHINGGTKQAITNVSAGSTNDAGGITSLDITRSPSVYLPE